jgi:hypothetical protein
MEEMSVMGEQTSSMREEHTYTQCKEVCVGYGHSRNVFSRDKGVKPQMQKIAWIAIDVNA